MRPARRLLLVVALTAGLAVSGPVPAAVGDEPVGGPQLGTRGVVVDPAAPRLPALTASGWLLADMDTGEVLAAKDPHGRYAPASTIKTLTALALIPELERDRRIVPTWDDVNVEGSRVGIVDRVAYPASELFTALMAVSGNDAANALATAAGGRERTAALMNAEARRLQALDTLAVNPSGLDAPGQVSSPYDLALIAREAMEDSDFRAYAATRRSSISAPGGARIEIYSHNRLLANYRGAIGIKNGYTSRARASFIGAATRGGRTLLVTLMKADPRVWKEAQALLDWGFRHGGAVTPVGELVEPVAERGQDLAAAAAPAALEAASVSAATAQPEAGGPSGWAFVGGAFACLLAAGLARRQQLAVRRRRRERLSRVLRYGA